MARGKKRIGVGAQCSVLIKRLHPQNLISEYHPNYSANERLHDVVVVRQSSVTRRGNQFIAIFVTHPSFQGSDAIHVAKRFCVVKQEGDPQQFFDDDRVEEEVAIDDDGNFVPEIDPEVFTASNCAEDIALLRNQGYDVDDDNEPAPENVPDATALPPLDNAGLFEGQRWGVDHHVDPIELHGSKRTPHFNEFDPSRSVSLSIFLKLFPWKWLRIVVISQTNKNLDQELSWGELLRYLGLWFQMSSVGGGYKKTDFWSTLPFDERTNPCPYNFRKYMSMKRFDAITAALSFTAASKPTYRDKFWEVRQLIVEWNKNMAEAFSPSWILCLDESMSIWHSRWTCPGWVFCPRKPHPFGNEYHSACCGMSGLMFSVELVEGKDHPVDLGPPEYEAGVGKTGGLLLRMLKSCFHTGRYVVLDSGFCVLKALVALHEKGIYAGALIKKRRYWPALVPGKAMDERFAGKSPGECEAITGTLNSSPYFIWGMKEPDYVMKIMATGGVLAEDETCRVTYRVSGDDRTTFRYKKPFDWHFRYRHAVDDHNNLRHALPSLEDTWVTQRWEVRVFAFFLAITEVNTYLACKYFVWPGVLERIPTLVEFRRKFSWALIDNQWISSSETVDEDDMDMVGEVHGLVTAPPHARIYRNRKWVCDANSRYQQYICRAEKCKKQVRTCCRCTMGHWLCNEHLLDHVAKRSKMG